MFNIRSITSNLGSIINNYNDNLGVLIIGDYKNKDIVSNDSFQDLNFFQMGGYQGCDFFGFLDSNSTWDNIFEDFIAMDKIFDIIILNWESQESTPNFNENLIKKISVILYNLLNDKGIIIYPSSLELKLNMSTCLNLHKIGYNIYYTKSEIHDWEDDLKEKETINEIIEYVKLGLL